MLTKTQKDAIRGMLADKQSHTYSQTPSPR